MVLPVLVPAMWPECQLGGWQRKILNPKPLTQVVLLLHAHPPACAPRALGVHLRAPGCHGGGDFGEFRA